MTNYTAFFGSITNNGSPSIQGSVVWRMDMRTGNIDGRGATWSNYNSRAISSYVSGGSTNNGVLRFNSTLSMNGTNAYAMRVQVSGGTNFAYITYNGTNYNWPLK